MSDSKTQFKSIKPKTLQTKADFSGFLNKTHTYKVTKENGCQLSPSHTMPLAVTFHRKNNTFSLPVQHILYTPKYRKCTFLLRNGKGKDHRAYNCFATILEGNRSKGEHFPQAQSDHAEYLDSWTVETEAPGPQAECTVIIIGKGISATAFGTAITEARVALC
ncbi:hypothetical protein STEG23_033889, partial [Scotinomys teguina]